jgi:hypothetical protein
MTVTVIDRIIITQLLSESAVKVMGEKKQKKHEVVNNSTDHPNGRLSGQVN